MRLLEPRHPDLFEATHPRIVEDLIAIAEAGHQEALRAIVLMLEDLSEHGLKSRYAKVLKGTPIWELKTRSRGGIKGGSRVYWFPLLVDDGEHQETVGVLVNAEVKAGSVPDLNKLAEALEVYMAFRDNPKTMIQRSS